MLVMSSCDDNNAPQPADTSSTTLLVYMVAANSLGVNQTVQNDIIPSPDKRDLEEMKEAARAGALGKNHRVIIFHSTYESDGLLYELKADGQLTQIKEYEGLSAVTVAGMSRVLDDVQALAPAEKFGIVFWGHGTGWIENGQDETGKTAPAAAGKSRLSVADTPVTTSYGPVRSKWMNVTSMRRALEGRDISFIYFDCCLMAGVEVAYELRECTPYIVASPSELPIDGMPYDLNLKELLLATPNGLRQAARNTFDSYNNKTSSIDRTCTISLICTDALPALARAVGDIYARTPLPHPAAQVTNYYGSSRQGPNLDLGEYVTALAAEAGIDTAPFDKALADAIPLALATKRIWDEYPIYTASGLATYVFNSPSAISNNGYERLEWCRDVAARHIHD